MADRFGHSPVTPLLLRLERWGALDRVVGAAQPVMDTVTADRTVANLLQGRWLGHALHPLLVEVPMGTWLSALLVDASGADRDGHAVQLLTGVGVLAALPTAASGWAELATAGQREKRVGVVHAGAMAAGLALQGLSLAQRARGNRAAGLASSVAAMGVIGVGGYLGGHLAVVREVGTSDPRLRRG